MQRQRVTLGVAAAVLAALVGSARLLPVPYVALEPGPVYNMLGRSSAGQPLVVVHGHQAYDDSGRLLALTVSVVGDPQHQPSLYTAIRGWIAGDTAVVPQYLIYPPDENVSQVQQQNQQDMTQSQQNATAAALRYLGIHVGSSVLVADVSPSTPAAGVLKAGDVVLSVDGTAVSDGTQVRKLITRRQPGEKVRLTISRNGTRKTVSVATIATGTGKDRHAIVGFAPDQKFTFPFQVDIHGLEDVGGPSAGMMLALSIIDRLTPGALTAGRTVAGTGTIDPDGTVGPIGGAQQKVVAAARAGAKAVLVPADDCAGAHSASPPGVALVRVTTLKSAVDALHNLATHPERVPRC